MNKMVNKLFDTYVCDPDSEHLRFGQWFVINYTKYPWSELFVANKQKAFIMIDKYLTDNCYIDTLPTRIKKGE
jgi:hypothetical protein